MTVNEDRSGEYRETLAADRELYPPPTAPLDVAKELYKQHSDSAGLRTLVAWRGGWMRWETTHWAELDTAELRSTIYDTLGRADYMHTVKDGTEQRPWSPDKRKVANVLEAMSAIGHLSVNVDPPSWIALHIADAREDQIISCSNGLLDLSTRKLIAHNPAFFNVISVAFNCTSKPPRPTEWLRFLDSVWGNDPDSMRCCRSTSATSSPAERTYRRCC